MELIVNGEPLHALEDHLTIARLLDLNKVADPELVSVQLNGSFVQKEKYDSIELQAKDEIEFLYFMGGGAA